MQKTFGIFILTYQHLNLMGNMHVGWQSCETGAPEIDPKRPYGNSDVAEDIANILGVNLDEDEFGEIDYEIYDELMKLHDETKTALQICLSNLSFTSGTYVKTKEYDDLSWKLVKYAVKRPLAEDILYFTSNSELINFAELIRTENEEEEIEEIEYISDALGYLTTYCSNLELVNVFSTTV